jgi:T-complex protein 1 subunit beta
MQLFENTYTNITFMAIKNLTLAKDVQRIVEFIKTSLGPKGMDKLMVSTNGDIKITNDGATILKNIKKDSIVVNILNEFCSVIDQEIGDGTTTLCCLIGELMVEAEKLINMNVHPQIIIQGYRIAAKKAVETIHKHSFNNSDNFELLCADLLDIARTSLNSKVIATQKELFARIALKAVIKLKGSTDLNRISIIKKCGGSLRDSFLDEGYILDKTIEYDQPKKIKNAKILITNTSLDSDRIKIYGAKIKVKSISNLARIELGEQKKVLDKCKKILAHKINVVINRQLIYNRQNRFFCDHGILSIEQVDFDGIEKLALATGAEITSTFDEPEKVRLGSCKVVEEIMIGDSKYIRFGGCPNDGSCSIVLRGSTNQILEEAERSIHDALCILTKSIRNPTHIWGGGYPEITMGNAIEKLSKNFECKKSLAIASFAIAIQRIPEILIENAGLESVFLMNKFKNYCKKGKEVCLNIEDEDISCVKKSGLLENSKLKIQIIISAMEAVEILIRIDKMFLNC